MTMPPSTPTVCSLCGEQHNPFDHIVSAKLLTFPNEEAMEAYAREALRPICRACGKPLADEDLDVEQDGPGDVWLHIACKVALA